VIPLKEIRVLVASMNPVKIKATTDAFHLFFKTLKIDSKEVIVPTANASQPIGENETRDHSKLRVVQARETYPGYDYYVGIEGGIVKVNSNKARIIVYSSVGHNIAIETIRGCGIPLPLEWYDLLTSHKYHELGDLAEQKSGVPNIKKKQGVVGFFSQNYVTRYDILKQSVIMALVPYLNSNIFS
jgi:inosine/xanthosine triphosphatase